MMKRNLLSFYRVALLPSFLVLTCQLFAQQLIPAPRTMEVYDGTFEITPQTRVYTNLGKSERKPLFMAMDAVLQQQLKTTVHRQGTNVIRLIKTGKADVWKEVPFNANLQGYTLDCSAEGITVKSPSAAGLYHALQTLKALLADRQLRYLHIEDTPRFAYRGLMLDCSRHFWTVDFIKKQIDMMARLKLNRLHLHLTDAAGWRMEVKRYPELVQKAAYRTHSDWNTWWLKGDRLYCDLGTPDAYGGYYTQNDLREIVRYAAQHYITVIPEIDIPGHSEEVTYTYPQLSCDGKVNSDLCIGNEATFAFVENVLKEVMDIFPSTYIHLGGDEASGEFWKRCELCQKRMHNEHLGNTAQLQAYMMKRVNGFLQRHGRKMIGWDEMIEGGLPVESTVMAWRKADYGYQAAKLGHHVIMSPISHYYINHYQDNPSTQPPAMGGYTPLRTTYAFEPIADEYKNTNLAQYIDGVQGNLWTEMVATEQYAEYLIYPRLFAVAETGWSSAEKDFENFRQRALQTIEQMKADGYHPFDLQHESGTRKETFQVIEHEAKRKPVAYLSPYAKRYRGAGDGSLTDGKLGDWSYNDGQWQGFVDGARMCVVVDMQQTTDLRDISAEFMQFREPWIFYPTEIEVEVSADGQKYELLDKKKIAESHDQYFIRTYTWRGQAKGRYIKLTAYALKSGGWIFCDEIMINRSN